MLTFGGIFGIHNHTLSLVAELILLFLAVIWVALIYWTFADARRRIDDGILIGIASLASLLPYAGTLIYMIVRPPEYLEDVRERDLEIEAAQARLAQFGMHSCPHCDYEIEKDFLRCPNCLRKLRDPCVGCGKPLQPEWRICPYCETEVGLDPTMVRRPRRPRRESEQILGGRPPSDLI
jgi:hypothetical protein